jgi:cytochrome c553
MNYHQPFIHAAFLVLLSHIALVQAESPPVPVGHEAAALIAQKKCVKCHSEDGNARAPMYPKIAGQNEQYLAQTMRAYRDGSRFSPIMSAQINEERSSDADIAVLAAYYAEKSRCSPNAPPQGSVVGVAGDYAAGQKVAEGFCTQCHQVTGQLVNPIWPKIAGQNAYYIRSSVTAYRDGQRTNDTMSPMVKHLTDADIANVAVFYASQQVCP